MPTVRCPYQSLRHTEPTNATDLLKMWLQLPRARNPITSRNRERGSSSNMRCKDLHSSSRHIQTHSLRPLGAEGFHLRVHLPAVLCKPHHHNHLHNASWSYTVLVQSCSQQSFQSPGRVGTCLAANSSIDGALEWSSLGFAFLAWGQQREEPSSLWPFPILKSFVF